MKYEKPELVVLPLAVSGIQHPSEKATTGTLESINPNQYASLMAYETDE
jgi:hypothetical protein